MRVVTVGMDRMDFLVPIYVGDLVTLSATVKAAWNTSMEVGVRVEAENPRAGVARHTSTAYITMVALDEEEKSARIPPLYAGSPVEQRRMREAELRRTKGSSVPKSSPTARRTQMPTETLADPAVDGARLPPPR